MATIREKMGHFIQMIAETTDLMRNLVLVTNAIIVWNTVYMQVERRSGGSGTLEGFNLHPFVAVKFYCITPQASYSFCPKH